MRIYIRLPYSRTHQISDTLHTCVKAEEKAKLESARRASEEKLRIDASERETSLYQQWVEVMQASKDAEKKVDELSHISSRGDSKIEALSSQLASLRKEECEVSIYLYVYMYIYV